ncbi:ESPR-type extended signal peptide-containing protein [Paraburkholderia rhizosphaerae]|uniref:Autotransporter adhesin n=1 Tax=Paraburkholderia rhizosphaerae TaxID=480658 RepID=A0A4R8M3Z4_9BURK|nr:ESPR-type extended signal peptide-containing protein [Paraburkholderia rhizosphaerae]TDY54552.1 autotransporter adhesin [Paraburkholderia rhizosphaerae]
MNKAYKSVWNESTGTYVAAAETARSAGKKSNRRARSIATAALASAATFGVAGMSYAADTSTVPKVPSNIASANSAAATPKPTNDWFFCFLFWCGGDGGSTTNITYNGVNAQEAYAYTYDRNNLKYFHVNSALPDSWAKGSDAISIGGGARANGTSTDGVTYGSEGGNTGNGPVAIGAASLAQGAQTVALGANAQASGLYHAVALGGDAQATSTYTTALGGRSLASADGSTALGSHASALGSKSVALGYESVATRANTVSVGRQGGERQIVNVAAGSAGTDAVNVNQLNAAIASMGGGGVTPPPPPPDPTDLKFFHANSTLADSTAGGKESVAIGGNATALAYNSAAIGSNSRADRANSVSFGSPGLERQLTNVAAGTTDTDAVNLRQLNTTVQSAITGGVPNLVQYDTSAHTTLTLGGVGATQPVTVSNLASGAITQNSTDAINGSQIFALATATNQGFQEIGKGFGALAQSTANALGGSASADTADGSITAPSYTVAGKTYHNVGAAIDALSVSGSGGSSADAVKYDGSSHTKVTLGGATASAPVALTNVAAGSVSATSSDAVSGAQLYQTSSSVASALGGASAVGADGRVSTAYTLDGTTYNNVGSALSAVNAKIGSGSANGVTYDTSAHDKVTLGGVSASAPVQVTNVAAARLDAGSKDAVNGSQLFATANSVAKVVGAGSSVKQDGTVTAPSFTISGTTYNDIGSAMNAIGAVGKDVQVTAKYVKVVSDASESMSLGSETTAIGGGAFAAGNRTLAIGTGARAQFDDSVALGSGAQAYEANTVSIGHIGGEKRITNVAAGINATDAATVGQLTALQQQLTKQSNGVKSMALLAAVPVTNYIAVSANTTPGAATHASDDLNAMAVGPTSAATGPNAVAVGSGAGALRTGSTAIGAKAGALGVNTTVIGVGATTGFEARNGVAIGYLASAETEDTLGIGTSSVANGVGSVAIGTNAVTLNAADSGVAIGRGATANASTAVALGSGSVADRANSVSVGNGTKQRQIVNVAAGTAKFDAVNVEQLTGITTALGGGAAVNTNGTIKQPAYTVGGQTYTDVGSAINAAALSGAGAADAVKYDTSARDRVTLGGTSATKRVTLANVADGKADADAVNVKQLKDLGASFDSGGNVNGGFVAYDDSTKQQVTLKGSGGTKITGVLGGTLSASSTDAVNGAQLFKTNQDVSNVAGNVTNLTNVVNNITGGGNGVKYFHANSTLADSSAAAANSVAIGGDARATASGSVALGSGALANRANTVSVGAAGAERQVVNVAAGTVDTDAVNLKQLKDLGASFDTTGGVSGSFVAYDDTTKTRVTLGGKSASVPVTLANVAAGKADSDAVNLKQLKDLGASIDTSGNVTTAFVSYDDTTRSTITLKGSGGTQITGLKSGALNAASTDAVNGAQLYQTNQNVTNLSNVVNNITGGGNGVKYFHANSTLADSSAAAANSVAIGGDARATASGSVALGSGALANRANTVSVGAAGAERQVVNVAAGTVDTDAVNLKQLKDLGASFDTTGGVSGSFVAYDDTTKTRVTLGGKSASAPVTLANVAAGKADSDAVNLKQLKDLGASIDTSGNVTSAFVAYDDATRGTVTLKGTDGTKITRVAAGTLSAASTDAVNGAQLFQTNQNVASVTGNVTNLTNVVNNITNGSGIKYFSANSTLDAAVATGMDSVAIGGNARATSANSVALGASSLTVSNLSAPAYQPGSLELAGIAPAGEVSVGSIGKERRVTNVAAGSSGTDAVNVSQLKSAVAASSSASLASAVLYDTSAHDSVTLGGTAAVAPVALKNVGAGQLAAASRDAVNGSQLFNTATTTAAALGGGAVAGADGMIKAPTYNVSGKTYGDVGSALAAVGYTVDTINSNVTSATKYISVAAPDDDPSTPEAKATGGSAVAIGSGALAGADQSIAIGAGAGTPQGKGNVALGLSAIASADGAMAMGSNAKARNVDSIAIGHNAVTEFDNSIAIGMGSRTDAANVVSVGNSVSQRRITHVADGIDATDAATVGQLAALKQQVVKQTAGVQSMLLGAKPVTDFIAVSSNTTPGAATHASDDLNAMAVGPTSAATGPDALAVGAGAGAMRTGSTAIGSKAGALGVNTTVIGVGATTGFEARNSVAIGYKASAEREDVLAVGSSAIASGVNTVALGSASVAERANTVSVGNATLQRQIINVGAGTGNFDAVNVNQLKGALAALGGGARLDDTGAVQAPKYTIGGQTYTDVGAALTAASTMGSGSDDAVTYDTSAHNRVSLGGTGASAPVMLTNLAAGAVTASSKDAINGAQLYGTADSLASALGGGAKVGVDGKVTKPTYSINGGTYDNVGTAFNAVDSALASGYQGPGAVVYDSTKRNRVTLGGVGTSGPVTVTNVADAKSDLDAVNLKQLKAAGITVDPGTGVVTNAFVAYDNASKSSVTLNAGGSATQLKNVADGVDQFDAVNVRQMQSYVTTQISSFTPPTPTVVVNDLPTGTASGDAIAIGNGSVASGTAAIAIGARTVTAGNQSVALGVGASAPATNSVALGANAVADRDNTVSVGSPGAERQITNVAAGSAPTDAVNVGQLGSAVNGIQSRINDMDRDNRRGIAAASALNVVTPYLPGRTTLNAGVAGYRGTAALGIGVSRWNDKGTVNYNLGVSSAGGNSTIVRAGVGIVFGN